MITWPYLSKVYTSVPLGSFGAKSGLFGLAMGILAGLHHTKDMNQGLVKFI